MALTPADADFTIAEVESEQDRIGAIAAAPNLPPIPKAIVTNFSPMTDAQGVPQPEKAEPLIAAGWRCLTESYLADNPNATPERLDFTATVKLGWPSSQPVFGVYESKPLSSYASYFDKWAGWSVYTSEYLDL